MHVVTVPAPTGRCRKTLDAGMAAQRSYRLATTSGIGMRRLASGASFRSHLCHHGNVRRQCAHLALRLCVQLQYMAQICQKPR